MSLSETKADTKQRIMDAAQSTVQALGYNALSFRELAKEVGVKSSSIHYHFPTKGDLGAALARRYTESARAFLDDLLASGVDTAGCMRQYVAAFRVALENGNRMCLCGIMNAEHDGLPHEVRDEVDRFTEVNVAWLATILARDMPASAPEVLQERATAIFAAIGGAQVMARGRDDITLYDRNIEIYRQTGLLPSGI
jgi:TetR/AcrR family transcriptional repressor of nem operon